MMEAVTKTCNPYEAFITSMHLLLENSIVEKELLVGMIVNFKIFVQAENMFIIIEKIIGNDSRSNLLKESRLLFGTPRLLANAISIHSEVEQMDHRVWIQSVARAAIEVGGLAYGDNLTCTNNFELFLSTFPKEFHSAFVMSCGIYREKSIPIIEKCKLPSSWFLQSISTLISFLRNLYTTDPKYSNPLNKKLLDDLLDIFGVSIRKALEDVDIEAIVDLLFLRKANPTPLVHLLVNVFPKDLKVESSSRVNLHGCLFVFKFVVFQIVCY